jgi:ParB-like nuclease domain
MTDPKPPARARRRRKVPAIVGIHRLADILPMLSDDELTDLADDIKTNGLRNPIEVTPEGLVLDGRNRWEACKRAGVDPTMVVYEGDPSSYANYVVSLNVTRRHLTPGQRAMATAKVLAEAGRRVDGRWMRDSIDITDVGNIGNSSASSTWRNAMNQAGTVVDHAPELVDAVIRGESPLHTAFMEADRRRNPRKQKKPKQPTTPSTTAVQLSDALTTLQRMRGKGLPPLVLQTVELIAKEAGRIRNENFNSIEAQP